ncbi:MAG TPA: glycerophosphodiester phosphodiesterase [Jiangellaceae bacterium]|nr:glycerophosphodiester phosphodiesterase [Jiangellaceae bacterium]
MHRPYIVAHRGASGYRPEHTLDAYRLAIALGADFIEPDLVVTADGVLVARHENELSTSTDVAARPEFTGRRTTKDVTGRAVTGWFVEDFTAAELATLRATERFPDLRQRNVLYEGRSPVPTFAEVIDLARGEADRLGRPVGVYPETKLAGYFADLGLAHDEPLLADLARAGPGVPVFIQSFESSSLRRLAGRVKVPLVQLLDATGPLDAERADDGRAHADPTTQSGLSEVAGYADVIGVHKSLLIPRDQAGRLGRPSGLMDRARAAGLAVHAWTFRNENAFLPAECRRGTDDSAFGDAFAEYEAFIRLGVDGLFTDFPDTALAACT